MLSRKRIRFLLEKKKKKKKKKKEKEKADETDDVAMATF